MKKIGLVFSLVLFFSISFQVNAQWYSQYCNQEYESYLDHIKFVNQDTGWVTGSFIILKTTNAGFNWDTLITLEHNWQNYRSILNSSFVDDQYGWFLEQDEVGTNRLYKTSDGGNDWFLQFEIPMSILLNLSFIDSNIGFVLGSTNPYFPNSFNKNEPPNWYSSITDTTEPSYPFVLKTTDGGNIWNTIFIDSVISPNIWGLYFLDSNNGWAYGEGIYKTMDGGITWNRFSDLNVVDLQFTSQDTGWCCDINGLWKTTNAGISWDQQMQMTTQLFWTWLYFYDSNIGYYCPSQGIYKTTDGGSTWLSEFQDSTLFYTDIFFISQDSGWCVGSQPSFIFSTINSNMPVELTSFTAQAQNQKIILKWITATELNNNGFEIQRRVAESDFASVGFIRGEGTTTNQKEYSYLDKNLADGKYYYRLKQFDYNGNYEYSNVIEVDVRSLDEYALEQNYPNPFNPVTTIGYVLKEKTNAKLILLNAIGEEVAVLVNVEQDKGFHKVDFNASSLASGIYFYRLHAGNFVETKKMILLK